MRKGQNPAKFVKAVAKPERITVAVLNYIPFLSGYYAESLDVLKICLDSLRKNTDLPFDLLVFDNGSCQEACDFLHQERDEGRIQYLILSDKNLGKGGAWNTIFGGAPGEIVAYADSDVLFYPSWLSKSVRVLETYPKVGMVTSRPYRTSEEFLSRSIHWAEQEPEAAMEQGQLLPWDWFYEFSITLGYSDEELKKIFASTRDFRVTYHGVTVFLGASHWQFVAWKSVMQQFVPFSMDRPMGQVKRLDQNMNEAGYLRLMVDEPLTMNMSNTLSPSFQQEQKAKLMKPSGFRQHLFDFPLIRKPLLALYNAIFNLYYK